MKCAATTKTGTRCRRNVRSGELLCATHGNLLTTPEIAERYGVSERTVRSWVREGMPAVRRGRQGGRGPLFHAGAVGTWIEARTEQDEKLSSALCRKLDAQSAKEARVLEQLARDYLPAGEVTATWAATCRAVRRRVNRMPSELAPEIMAVLDDGPAAVGAVLDAEVRKVLTELACPSTYDDLEPSSHPVPQPGPVSQSETVRAARAQLATLQALVIETRNRVRHYELLRRRR